MNKMQTVIKVGIADLNIVKAPDTIRTSGLGSCVGAVIYDLPKKIAGMAHVMLPDSSLNKQSNLNESKYADTAIPKLIELLVENGARKSSLQAKLAGGAQMFQLSVSSDTMRIGPRNVEAVERQLEIFRIPIIASDVGGNCGRTIEFEPETGKLKIKTVNKGETYI
ncbi:MULTISPECIES: chemotaxis protein CheD [unclassified Virgibacillus]|uniref:chemotaxis protein CheD n=1 Tax=unclassified Virgibacillus TaxID=2620237 RepID=UPI0024DE6214|nr:chemotaxis protein CheD [Virgibacillus sp. LDC-1]